MLNLLRWPGENFFLTSIWFIKEKGKQDHRFTRNLPLVTCNVTFLVERKSLKLVRVKRAKLPSKKEVQTKLGTIRLARCIFTV